MLILFCISTKQLLLRTSLHPVYLYILFLAYIYEETIEEPIELDLDSFKFKKLPKLVLLKRRYTVSYITSLNVPNRPKNLTF